MELLFLVKAAFFLQFIFLESGSTLTNSKKCLLQVLFLQQYLTILPFFAIFVYFKNFSQSFLCMLFFLFIVIVLRELIKDLENMKGAIANNFTTFPVAYGERKTKQVSLFLMTCNVHSYWFFSSSSSDWFYAILFLFCY